MPPEASATETSGLEERELLLAILAKLDSLESRFERESSLVSARLDAMAAEGGVALTGASLARNAGGAGGVPQQITALRLVTDSIMAGQRILLPLTDSVMALSNFLASGASQPFQGFVVCGGLKVGGAGDLKTRTMGDADGQAGVGVKPWDTGAMAQVELTQRFILELGASAGVEVGGSACVNLSNIGSNPPTRASSNPVIFGNAGAGLENTLMSLQSRLGLDAQRLDRTLVAGTDVFQSGTFGSLRALATDLPLPTQFTSPLSVVRAQLTTVRPVELLCSGGGLGSGRILEMASQGCGFIEANDLPALDTFLDLGENFTSLSDTFDDVCKRVNNMLGRQVDIGLSSWGDGTLDLRLFPAAWVVDCTV